MDSNNKKYLYNAKSGECTNELRYCRNSSDKKTSAKSFQRTIKCNAFQYVMNKNKKSIACRDWWQTKYNNIKHIWILQTKSTSKQNVTTNTFVIWLTFLYFQNQLIWTIIIYSWFQCFCKLANKLLLTGFTHPSFVTSIFL